MSSPQSGNSRHPVNNSGRIARRLYPSLRLPALLLTLSLAMLLTACGGSSDETGSDPTNPSTGAGPDQSDIKGPVSLSWTAPEQRENGDRSEERRVGKEGRWWGEAGG